MEPLDSDGQCTRPGRRRGDGVAAFHLRAVDLDPDREVLAGFESELLWLNGFQGEALDIVGDVDDLRANQRLVEVLDYGCQRRRYASSRETYHVTKSLTWYSFGAYGPGLYAGLVIPV